MPYQNFLVVDVCGEGTQDAIPCALGIGTFSTIGMTEFKYFEFSHCAGEVKSLAGNVPMFDNVEQELFLQLQGNVVCFRSGEAQLSLEALYKQYKFALPIFQRVNLQQLMQNLYPEKAEEMETTDCSVAYQGKKVTRLILEERIGKMGQFVIDTLDTEKPLESLILLQSNRTSEMVC